MKENRIKLLAACALAVVFMITFTCCVRTDMDSGQVNNSRITLFAPPESNPEATTTTPDEDVTTEPIITMPPIGSSQNETTSTPEVTETVAPETTRPADTVYSGFSGLY